MSRRFALLRGINLGGRRVKGPALRAAFEALGFDDVATFLASGNVIFSAGESHAGESDASDRSEPADAALERRIEAGLRDALGYDVATFVRGCDELARAASPARLEASPLAGADGVAVNVTFLREPPSSDLREAVLALRAEDDDFLIDGRELYWLRRGRISESPAWAAFGKALDRRGTTRNLNTVRRLLSKFCD